MGLCYSLRPRLFGDAGGGGSISSAGAASEPEVPAEPHATPQPQPLGVPLRPGGKPGGEADGPPLLLQNGGGNGAAPERQPALPKAGGPGLGGGGKAARQQALHQPPALQRTWEKLRLEEREAEKEARKVSKSIDRALKEQKREYKQTHRLLLLGEVLYTSYSFRTLYSSIDWRKSHPFMLVIPVKCIKELGPLPNTGESIFNNQD